jgi:hypothetical protein
MKKQPVTLEDLLQNLEQKGRELDELKASEEPLRAEKRRLHEEITKTMKDGDPESLVEKFQRELNAIAQQINEAVGAGIDGIQREAHVKLEAFRAKLESELSVVCGGDAVRTRKALLATLEACELHRWLKDLPRDPAAYGQLASDRVKKLRQLEEGFAAGRSLSASWALRVSSVGG